MAETKTTNADCTALVRDLILRACAAPDSAPEACLAAIDQTSARDLVEQAIDTRTAPLLHRVIRKAGNASAPVAGLEQLEIQAAGQLRLALLQRRALVRGVRILDDAGIRAIALKGFALSFDVYPDASLRPLRDIDLLVPRADAVRARDLLLQNGFERLPEAGEFGLERMHQLPEIADAETGTVFEIHHRLSARGWQHDAALVERLFAEARVVEVFGTPIQVPSNDANLLHLLAHAGPHHAFSNGPLILADMHYLHATGTLDQERLQRDIDTLGLRNTHTLIGALAERYGSSWFVGDAAAPDGPVHRFMAEATETLFMSEEEERQRLMLQRLETDARGSSRLLAAAGRAVTPDAAELAKIADCHPTSWRRWLAYPRWLARRGKRFADLQRSRRGSSGALRQWLQQ